MAALPRSWTRTCFEWFGTRTVRVALGLAALSTLVFLAQEAFLGRLDATHLGGIRLTLTHIAIVAYVLGAYAYCEQSRDRTIERIWPLLDPERAKRVLDSANRDRLTLGAAALVGIAASLTTTLYVTPGPASYDVATFDPENAWHRALAPVMGIWTLMLSVRILIEAGRLSNLARTLREIDLLDLAALEPFSRQALNYALLAIGMVSVYALFIVEDIGYWALVVTMLVATVGVGSLALLLPLRGVRDRVRQAKSEELGWCRERMRVAREKLAEDAGERGRLEELIAWEARIEDVNEWTLDASAFTRFALYLLLPLGSWAGGALVERFVDSLLD